MLADYLTVQENFGRLEGLTLVYCGDGRNNVANSLLVTGAILGVNVHIFSPKELFPEKKSLNWQKDLLKKVAHMFSSLKMLMKQLKMQTFFTQTFGYQWVKKTNSQNV